MNLPFFVLFNKDPKIFLNSFLIAVLSFKLLFSLAMMSKLVTEGTEWFQLQCFH